MSGTAHSHFSMLMSPLGEFWFAGVLGNSLPLKGNIVLLGLVGLASFFGLSSSLLSRLFGGSGFGLVWLGSRGNIVLGGE